MAVTTSYGIVPGHRRYCRVTPLASGLRLAFGPSVVRDRWRRRCLQSPVSSFGVALPPVANVTPGADVVVSCRSVSPSPTSAHRICEALPAQTTPSGATQAQILSRRAPRHRAIAGSLAEPLFIAPGRHAARTGDAESPPAQATALQRVSTCTPSAATSRSCSERVHGQPLSGSTTPPPRRSRRRSSIASSHFYEHENSNIHRAAHTLAARATDAYEARARERARASSTRRRRKEIVFVRGTTEGINLVAQSWGRRNIGAGDEIVITLARAPRQHRALAACSAREKGARLRVAPGRRPRPDHPRGVREAARPAHAARRVHAGLERARHRSRRRAR